MPSSISWSCHRPSRHITLLPQTRDREHQRAFLALDEKDRPYGIGELHGDELAAIAVLPNHRGTGTDLAISLLKLCPGEDLKVTVASDNDAAMHLYEKLGFHLAGVESKWFRVG